MDGGQRDAQPASAFVVAEQHHGGAFGVGESGEKFSLAGEFMTGTDDGFLVDRRGDKRVEFAAQAAFRAGAQPGHCGAGRRRRTRRQIFRQWFGQRIRDKEPAGVAVTGELFQRQIESGFLVEAIDRICVADQQVAPVVIGGFRSDGFERDFGADACDIAKCNADPASH